MARPIEGVTGDNFVKKAKNFMALNECGHVVAIRLYPGAVEFRPQPRQWGAWLAYWQRIGYRCRGVEARGYATVPTEWPHDFDVAAGMNADDQAGEMFFNRWERERSERRSAADAIQRAATVTRLWRQIASARRVQTPDSHLAFADAPLDLSEFPDAGASKAEIDAWAKRREAAE